MTISRYLAATVAALACWTAALALVAIVAEPTPAVIAFGSRATLVQAAATAGGAVTALGRWVAQVRSEDAGLARALYAGGAWLVLPIPDSLCFGDPPARR